MTQGPRLELQVLPSAEAGGWGGEGTGREGAVTVRQEAPSAQGTRGRGGERQAQSHRWAGQGEVKDGGALVACDSLASGDRFWRSPLATCSRVWEERMCRLNRGSVLESLHSGWGQRRRGCWKESWGKS